MLDVLAYPPAPVLQGISVERLDERKELERQSSRGGFTSLVISFGAMLATTTTEAINAALKHSRVAEVYNGCKRHLSTTRFGKRKITFAEIATEPG